MKNLIACLVITVLSSITSAQTPVVNEDYKLLASDGDGWEHFGWGVSISSDGTTVIVGASNDDNVNGTAAGSVYIYELVGGVWQETKLLASDGISVQLFGRSVAISSDGTTAIAGAERDDDNGLEAGSAYIYTLVGGVWQETKLLASDGASTDYFGGSVSISSDGTTAIVGAVGDDDNGDYSGSAYIYRFDGIEWVEETKLLASDGASTDTFGGSVSISGDGTTAIVGAVGDDDNGDYSGSAYIYSLVGGVWYETKLLASDGAYQDFFGTSVSISSDGTTSIVGAERDDDNFGASGSAYIYGFDGSEWVEETKLTASDGASDDHFGNSVAISNDGSTVIVAARVACSAYIYRFVGKQWIEETKLLASDGAFDDDFGESSSISSNGSTVIIGAHEDDDNGSNSGSAYIFEIGVDSDGDGILDYIDNCYLYNPDQADCNGNGIGDVCDIADFTSLDCDQNGVPDECQPDCDGDGWIDPCDTEGDCDGDGIPDNCEADCNENDFPDDCDIIFGISQDCNENGVPDECDLADDPSLDCDGNALLDECEIESDPSLDCDNNGILDSCELTNEQPIEETKLLASDGAEYDLFGRSVSISSDGTTAIAGAYRDDDNGSAYIYSLIAGVWQETKLLASDGASDDRFGWSVSISGDGSTAIVGAGLDDDNGSESGSAYIYELVGGVWEETKLTASDGAYNYQFGRRVSISSDGTTAIVGARFGGFDGSFTGSVYIYKLVSGVWQEEVKLTASDGAFNDRFGHSVAISSDGTTAIVGAHEDDDNGDYSGSAYIYSLVGGVWQETKLLPSDGAAGDSFGHCVAISGDTVVVGTPLNDDNGSQSGSAYIYRFDGSNWIETKLTASDGDDDDEFGSGVATNGDKVVVGASHQYDSEPGNAYIYRFDGSNWIETKILASDGAIDDNFGYSVSISSDGTTALVGAYGAAENGYVAGAAYVFTLPLSTDCNNNSILDACEIEEDPTLDCNADGILDSCQELEDCDENGIPDICDLQDPNNDQNNNGELDDCECIGDITADGIVNIHDLLIVIGSWGSANPAADFNFDGIVNIHDLLIFIGAWGPCDSGSVPPTGW